MTVRPGRMLAMAMLCLMSVPVAAQACSGSESTMSTHLKLAQLQDKAMEGAQEKAGSAAQKEAERMAREKASDAAKEQMPGGATPGGTMPHSDGLKAPATPEMPNVPGQNALPGEPPKIPGK